MATTAATPLSFTFPREYYFPAFFTRQTNLNTLHAQLVKWSTLVLSYCRYHRLFKLSLSPGSTTTSDSTVVDTEELFHNRRLNRRLALADIKEVIDFMRKEGRAEYVGSEGTDGGDVVWVYWRTPEEWAALIEGWIDETAQKGTVLTLYELTEGEGTRGTGMWCFLFQFCLLSDTLSIFFGAKTATVQCEYSGKRDEKRSQVILLFISFTC